MLLPQSAQRTVGHKHSTPRSVGTTAAARDLVALNVSLQGVTVSLQVEDMRGVECWTVALTSRKYREHDPHCTRPCES